MHEVRVALDVGEAIDPHRPRGGDAAHVVPPEVHQHHVLGDLLLVVQQFVLQFEVLGFVDAASPGARDRSIADQSVVDSHQHLGRRTDDLNVTESSRYMYGEGLRARNTR